MKTKLETQVDAFFNMIKDTEYYSKGNIDDVLAGAAPWNREARPSSSKLIGINITFNTERIGQHDKFDASLLLTEEEKDQYIKERLEFFKANAEKFTGDK